MQKETQFLSSDSKETTNTQSGMQPTWSAAGDRLGGQQGRWRIHGDIDTPCDERRLAWDGIRHDHILLLVVKIWRKREATPIIPVDFAMTHGLGTRSGQMGAT